MPLNIQISDETEVALTALKHPGQTWDGIIQEILQELEAAKQPMVSAKK